MKNESLLYGIIGLLAGIVIMFLFSPNQGYMMGGSMHMNQMKNETQGESMMGEHGSNMTMDEMSESLKNLKGDDFDKAFIEMMIDHHEGAVDMANVAKLNAKHAEIKKLSNDIISTQTKEIVEMKQWYQNWDY